MKEGKRGANIKKEGTEGAYNPPNYPVERKKNVILCTFSRDLTIYDLAAIMEDLATVT